MEYVKAHDKPPVSFKDILKERHKESDFIWVSREINFTKAYKQSKEIKNPICLQQDVLKSLKITKLIEEEAKEKNVPEKEVYRTVKNILTEIGCSKHLPVVRWLGYVLLKVMKQTVSALYVNEEKLLKIKSEMGNNPVLFVPSHRSYADFILMAYVMFNYSIDIPCVAAGMDFHSMWVMGRLLRDCSAFFMRRSFAEDKLYRTVFDEYVKKLVCLGQSPIEFFIEGTRSRSSKSLMPKFGLLTMLLESFFTGEVPDITIVPVNISYDRTLEDMLFAYEMLGVAKPKESTSALIKGINMLDEKYGNVYVNFCEPISVHKYIWSVSGGDVSYVDRSVIQEQHHITHLAHSIVDSQQKHRILTCFNVLALVLSNHMRLSQSPVTLEKATKDVAWLSSVLSVLGAYVKLDENTMDSLLETIKVHKSLVTVSDNKIQLVGVHSPEYKIDPSRIKGHRLKDETMSVAVPLLMLQQYVNPCMHFIVSPAIITVIMQHLGDSSYITKGELFGRYQFLRALLSNEFVLIKEWEVKEFEDALLKLELVNIIESSTEKELALGNHKKLQIMMCNLLYPFLSGYLSLGQFLLQMNEEPLKEKTLLQMGQKKIEDDLLNRLILNPYSLSLDMITCAISSFTSLEALKKLRMNGEIKYTVMHDRLSQVVNQLDELIVKPQVEGDPLALSAKHTLLDPTTLRAKL